MPDAAHWHQAYVDERMENKRLRAALEKIASLTDRGDAATCLSQRMIAREALNA
jgi:hypothetical protein